MTMMRLIVICLLVSCLEGFQFMSNWKMPTIENAVKDAQTREKFGDKKLVVITGASSGLGRKTAQALLRTGDYHVIGAVRDLDKMEVVAELDGFNMDLFTPMHCELNSFDSVREFCHKLEEFKMNKPIDRLICNAGIYQPSLPEAKWSMDGHEQTMQVNYLSHFLMISLLFRDMVRSPDPRIVAVGSVTGNDNTVGGGGVYPIADLHELDGFKAGFENPISMADGYGFIGAKSYKDSKLCLMMMMNLLHTKYHKQTGITFSSMYPGCIAESPLFREKRAWFRKYFPVFMKFITGGFVGEEEAGQRLFQVAHDPRCSKSGVYWSWNGGPREGRGLEAIEKGGQISGGGGAGGGWDSIYENDQSDKVLDVDLATKLFRYSCDITGADWPTANQIKSPCPTLKVIGTVSKAMVAREEMKRMRERPGFHADGTPIKVSKLKKVQLVADRAVGWSLRNTIGRPIGFLRRRLLGDFPDAAKEGSFQETRPQSEGVVALAKANQENDQTPTAEQEPINESTPDMVEQEDIIKSDILELQDHEHHDVVAQDAGYLSVSDTDIELLQNDISTALDLELKSNNDNDEKKKDELAEMTH